MTETVNVHDAKTRFSELLRRVEQGEEIVIARAGTPVARMSAVGTPVRRFGFMSLGEIPAGFFDPMTEEELAQWEKAL